MGQQAEVSHPTVLSEREQMYKAVDTFAHGTGPILSKNDQRIALGAKPGNSEHLPSNESLLEQLRTNAKHYEDVVAPASLKGKDSPSQYSEYSRAVEEIDSHTRGILSEMDQVRSYSAQQLRDIGDLANAGYDPKKLHDVMQRFANADYFTSLEPGLQLELQRRGRDPLDIGTSWHRNEHDERVPTLEATSRSGKVLNIEGKPEKS
ncbi:MAG TPA: hypothetical protein V6C86_10155 [Oculatellaceae cyanobacterium]